MRMLSFLTNLWNSNATVVLLFLILIVVAVFVVYYLKKAKEHPKGLIAAALSNMGERFGYYIMNAVLLLFLVSKFGLPDGTAGLIYSFFYFGIYILALVGGLIADKTQNYNRTIQIGLFIMAAGYVALAIPLFSKVNGMVADGNGGWWGILIFTCVALLCIAFGNGLFKGNLQALVGKLYDEFEVEEAKKGPEALKIAKDKRDSGFQIFYVFINIGGVIAPFIAPMLRKWWLGRSNFIYNADMAGLCHKFLGGETSIVESQKFIETSAAAVTDPSVLANPAQFCSDYVQVFNTGIHWAFIVSACAMLTSLFIFLATKHKFPQPGKKVAAQSVEYTAEEKQAMAKEIKQRMAALFAVLGIAIFFWLSFHQNGQSLMVFARDFVDSSKIAPEISQALNPLYVIILTPIVMAIFAGLARKGKAVSTPRKIARFPRHGLDPDGCRRPGQIGLLGDVRHLLLPDRRRAADLAAGSELCLEGGAEAYGWSLPGSLAWCDGHRQPLHLRRPDHAQCLADLEVLGRVPPHLSRFHVRHARHGEVAGEGHQGLNPRFQPC